MSAKYPDVSKTDIDKFYHGKYTQEHLEGSESDYSMNNIKDDLEKMVQDMSMMSESEQQQQGNINESVAESEVSVSDNNEEYKQYNKAYKKTISNTEKSKSHRSATSSNANGNVSGAQINPAKIRVNKIKPVQQSEHNNSSNNQYNNHQQPEVISNASYKQSSNPSQSEIEYSVEDKTTLKEKLSKSNIDVSSMSEATLLEINKMMNKYLELDNEIKLLSKQRSSKNKERTTLKKNLEQIMIKYKQNELVKGKDIISLKVGTRKEAFNKDCVSKKLAELIGDSTTAEQIATYIYDSRIDTPNVMITRKQNMEHPSVKKDSKAAIPTLDWKQIINNLK
jgi:hypothetical protein